MKRFSENFSQKGIDKSLSFGIIISFCETVFIEPPPRYPIFTATSGRKMGDFFAYFKPFPDVLPVMERISYANVK